MSDRHVVVGGGVAGIAAALHLADAGHSVTLVESRPRLGGAACSFPRQAATSGLVIDNGQHVFLRCCTAYRALLDRIGGTELTTLQPHLDIPVLAEGGRRAALRRTPRVPAPLHLGAALTRYGLLSWPDRLRAGRAVLALLRTDPADPRVDAQSFGAFLRKHGQSDAAIERLWGDRRHGHPQRCAGRRVPRPGREGVPHRVAHPRRRRRRRVCHRPARRAAPHRGAARSRGRRRRGAAAAPGPTASVPDRSSSRRPATSANCRPTASSWPCRPRR